MCLLGLKRESLNKGNETSRQTKDDNGGLGRESRSDNIKSLRSGSSLCVGRKENSGESGRRSLPFEIFFLFFGPDRVTE